ncbi:MAG: hypothetical protein WAL42_12715, partial [Nitrososphaeraceae archaeon]
ALAYIATRPVDRIAAIKITVLFFIANRDPTEYIVILVREPKCTQITKRENCGSFSDLYHFSY